MTLTTTLAVHVCMKRTVRTIHHRHHIGALMSSCSIIRQQLQLRNQHDRCYHGTTIGCRDGSQQAKEELTALRQRQKSSSSSMVLYDSLTQTFKNVPMTAASISMKDKHADEHEESNSTSSTRQQQQHNTTEKGIAWYTCGPTTYAPAHLGHGRTYVCLDIIRRIMEHTTKRTNKPAPLFVMNITDVDDKILTAATEAGVPPLALAHKYEAEFWSDWDDLGCLRPHVVTRVSDHVESDIVPYIDRIVTSEMAYVLPQDGVYFDVRAYEDKMGHLTKYGKLAPPTAATDFFSTHHIHDEIPTVSSSSGGDSEDGSSSVPSKKRDVRDFVLWKHRKEGESLSWSSPWGEGRPGWHIECSAMIESVQKQFETTHTFQIHAGGIDLKFPHHTNEIAQAEAYHYPRSTSYAHNKQEWIPHWVHTGHLHISGLKMSKSLKNFITIQDMLSRETVHKTMTSNTAGTAAANKSTLSSPADDFRLWCLGLSGSYRGPATYSKDRLDEAKVLREKIVRFLLDAQEWIQRRNNAVQSSSNKWRDQDQILFQRCIQATNSCHDAIAGRASSSHSTTLANDCDDEDEGGKDHGERESGKGEFDFNGAAYLDELVAIAEAGSSYLHHQSSLECHGPVEPVEFAIHTLRDLLSLVGFSNTTVQAGKKASNFTSNDDSDADYCNVLGGERALVEELVQFRSIVRKAALEDTRNKVSTDNMKDILKVCDDLRDDTLPRMGIQILDSTVNGNQEDDDDSVASASSPSSLNWKTCIPLTTKAKTHAPPSSVQVTGTTDIPLEDMFRAKQYEGMFSEYDDDGIPTRNADGSEVSKRLLKKLKKKRDKYVKRRQT